MFIIPQANAQLDCADSTVVCTVNSGIGAAVQTLMIPATIPVNMRYRTRLREHDTVLNYLSGATAIRILPTIGELLLDTNALDTADASLVNPIVEYAPPTDFTGDVAFTIFGVGNNVAGAVAGHDYQFMLTVEMPMTITPVMTMMPMTMPVTMPVTTNPDPVTTPPATPTTTPTTTVANTDRSDERDRIKDTAAAISVAAIAAWTINYVVAGTALDGKVKSYALPLSNEHYEYGLQIKPNDNLDIGLSVTDKSYVENQSNRSDFYQLKIEYRF